MEQIMHYDRDYLEPPETAEDNGEDVCALCGGPIRRGQRVWGKGYPLFTKYHIACIWQDSEVEE